MENKDLNTFHKIINQKHLSVDPCFMTGKGCVYTDAIAKAIKERTIAGNYEGFMVMPFRPNLDVFFHNTLRPFFIGNYQGDKHSINEIDLIRADEVRRPGIIICEGICKRIQESNFVVVDISIQNDNVFYELGLAYGIGHKIITIYHRGSEFGKKWAAIFESAGLKSYPYDQLSPIKIDNFTLSNYIWKHNVVEPNFVEADTDMVFYENYKNEVTSDKHSVSNEEHYEGLENDIKLSFKTHVLSNIGLATNKIINEIESPQEPREVIKSYLDTIRKLKEPKDIQIDATFQEIKTQVDGCYCLVVRTGRDCHAMSYFWLGYGHAQGKNVIPITVIKEENDGKNKKENIDDLAFDIRAQRHMVFMASRPLLLQRQLENTLREMIDNDFSEWSRKRFWNKVLGRRGEVHIFTGALHNEEFNREMIGDWDLRAASELTSYFSRHHYRAKIETPIYSPEYALKADPKLDREIYIKQLKGMMKDKNCILIASPDVNPLTEIVLGEIYEIDSKYLFLERIDTNTYNEAVVAIKENPKIGTQKEDNPKYAKRAFFSEVVGNKNGPYRGFKSNQIPSGSISTKFVSQQVNPESFDVYAHLVIAPNPFTSQNEDFISKYIIILNGVSGPATFALTHVLTGGVNEEFVSYEDKFNPHAASENILKQMLMSLPTKPFRSMECIIKVTVGPAHDKGKPETGSTFDWRRILKWNIDSAFKGSIRVLR